MPLVAGAILCAFWASTMVLCGLSLLGLIPSFGFYRGIADEVVDR